MLTTSLELSIFKAKIGGISNLCIVLREAALIAMHKRRKIACEVLTDTCKQELQTGMATMDSTPPEPETDGVNAALERVRALESRIRQAIQMNNRDLERPLEVVDRERSALDSIE